MELRQRTEGRKTKTKSAEGTQASPTLQSEPLPEEELIVVFMALAMTLKKLHGKDIALAVPAGFDAKTPLNRIYPAVTLEDHRIGHTCVFNLIQHLSLKDDNMLRGCSIYTTKPPELSDIGIFIMRCNLSGSSNNFLFYAKGSALIKCQPTSDRKEGIMSNLNILATYPKAVISDLEMARVYYADIAESALAKPDKPIPTGMAVFFTRLYTNVLFFKGKTFAVPVPPPPDHYSEGITKSLVKAPTLPPSLDYQGLDEAGRQLFDAIFMAAAYALPILVSIGHEQEKQCIGVILAKSSGEILSWGTDLTTIFHGEVTTIRRWQESTPSLVQKARLYTSLEPCNMCAGLIAMYADKCDLDVLFGQNDPGVTNPATKFPTALKGGVKIRDAAFGGLAYKKGATTSFVNKLDDKYREHADNVLVLDHLIKWINSVIAPFGTLSKAFFVLSKEPKACVAELTKILNGLRAVRKDVDRSLTTSLTLASTRKRMAKAARRFEELINEIHDYSKSQPTAAKALLDLHAYVTEFLNGGASGGQHLDALNSLIKGAKNSNVVKATLGDISALLEKCQVDGKYLIKASSAANPDVLIMVVSAIVADYLVTPEEAKKLNVKTGQMKTFNDLLAAFDNYPGKELPATKKSPTKK